MDNDIGGFSFPSKINLNELIPFHYAYVKRDQYPYVFYLFLQQYCFKNIQDQTRSNEKKNLLVSVIHF